jgi:nucleoside phosphorylase
VRSAGRAAIARGDALAFGSAGPLPLGVAESAAYEDLMKEEKEFYDEKMFSIERFSLIEQDWANRISARIRYISQSKMASLNFSINNFDTDLLIVCARYENEFDPIEKAMKWVTPPIRHSMFFPDNHCLIGMLKLETGSVSCVCVCLEQMGIGASASIVSNAITVFRPRIVSMLGMCCGFGSPKCSSPSTAGDVIVVRESACWEEGKYAPEFKNRARVRTISDTFEQKVAKTIENANSKIAPKMEKYIKSNKRTLERQGIDVTYVPRVKYGMLVSGSSVVASSDQVEEIMDRFPAALGTEMEMYGVYTAAALAMGIKPTPIGVKGVADFGDGGKHDKFQKYASVLSFITLEALLAEIFLQPEKALARGGHAQRGSARAGIGGN